MTFRLFGAFRVGIPNTSCRPEPVAQEFLALLAGLCLSQIDS